mmetsp:Transcript_58178/g.168554  ORF Transcript_58178/g.168554 Transcript_58178/m.168554 type:complete len:286 (-) Transcript_58178:856-1713(-)|eukprot:CAMPEP_0176058580 /NCGR_PEP_ID=MMETSP0120_2-20121206/29188_1 /TAXON_ID=160619 /ORGANISM="Kryptoperidinium foliaceum, Strain CCMP 1326" /LENGTH=285 /DNA_ID=CAMNT_0017392109 /DNA_START=69 /DNA_END=926 /DNA_ORIENTATION=+
MPAKTKKKEAAASKKADQKKKQKIVEDKTFGLKNKNKSKKVQQHIESVTKNVMNSGNRRERQQEEQRKAQKAAMKARKKAEKEEQDALFGEALLNIKKKTTTNKKEGKTEAKGRDADEENKKGTSRAMKMMYQMDAQEMEAKLKEDPNYVPTLEDQIEAERQKKVAELKKSGKGTPVNPETFAAWMEKKRKKREAEAKKMVDAEMRKKKGGKGLAVLSGRDLFSYKQDLFNVDENSPEGQDDEKLSSVDEKKDDQNDNAVEEVAAKVQSELFLEGDDDLDDLDDD